MNNTKIIYSVISVILLVCIFPLLVDSVSEDSIRWAVRRSVDIAFIMFFFSFGASALHLLSKSHFSTWLLTNRRYIGISFGVAFLSHAALITLLIQLYPEPLLSELTNDVIYTGIIAFSFTALMTATSNNSAVKLLGRKLWSSLHTVGGYYLLAVFSFAYLSKLDQVYFWPYALAVVSLVLLRLYKIVKHLKHRADKENHITQNT